MGTTNFTRRHLLLAAPALLAGCAVPQDAKTQDVAGLEQTLQGLRPWVSADEAQRVARLSYGYSLQLRDSYGVTDTALIHNAKVNQGLRPRGLCWHWADDLEARLRQEDLQSMMLYRAIANSDNLRIEHSTVIISAKGTLMEDGVVLDPWRYGGHLFWARVPEDTRYRWLPRESVWAERRA